MFTVVGDLGPSMFTVVGDLGPSMFTVVGDHLDHQCSLWSVITWTINVHCGR